jgi:hypothetical protein
LINLNLNLLFGSYYGTALMGRQLAGASPPAVAGRTEQAGPSSGQVQAIEDDNCREIYEIEDDTGAVRRIKGAGALSGPKGSSRAEESPAPEQEPQDQPARVEDRFRGRLEDSLQKPGAGRDQAASAVMAESLKTAAVEIGGALGQAKANQFMNKVLTATAAEASEDSVGLAVESIFSELAATSKESPAAYQRLAEIKKTLNRTANLGLGEGLEADDPEAIEGPPSSPAKTSLTRRFAAGKAAGSLPAAARALGNLVDSFI